jgi:hypothetical protein
VMSNNYLQDTSAYQLVNMGMSNMDKKFDYLILLNISYDTAALSDHQIFKNQTDWMLSTINILFSKFSNLNIAIRQHPAENIIQYRSRDNYEKLIKEVVLSDNQHINLFKYDSPVSTYDLINNSKVIIVNTSTIGIESAMLGKTVVTENKSYFANADFVFNCSNMDQYIDKLIEARDSCQNLERSKSDNAALYYYMVHCCAIHYTKFTPQDIDMTHILKQDPKLFFELIENSAIFEAILKSNSLAITAHGMRAST